MDEQRTQGTLDPRATARVISKACEVGARLYLRKSGGDADHHCMGTLGSTDGTTLEFHLDEVEPHEAAIPADTTLVAELVLGGRRYTFETQCVGSFGEDSAGVVQLTHPLEMTVSERRRSRRRKLVAPSKVTLRIVGEGSGAPGWDCRGALLNLSMRGLACRVARVDAARTPVSTTIRVEFRAGSGSPKFDLLARVVGITESASRDHTVVGVEFILNETYRQAREAFRRALEGETNPEAY